VTSREEMHAIAEEAAEKTVAKMLLALGVDASDPEAVIAMQNDFRHLRAWREASDTVKRHSLKTAVSVLVTGAVAYLLVFFGLKGVRS
jgi:hypothetical protein